MTLYANTFDVNLISLWKHKEGAQEISLHVKFSLKLAYSSLYSVIV